MEISGQIHINERLERGSGRGREGKGRRKGHSQLHVDTAESALFFPSLSRLQRLTPGGRVSHQ